MLLKVTAGLTILAVGPSLVSPQHHQAESCRMSAQFPPDDRTGQFSINFFFDARELDEPLSHEYSND